FVMRHSYWGPAFDDRAVADALEAERAAIDERRCLRREWSDPQALDEWTAVQIADGRVVGWFQGRMEWGARALGNRSIVADPMRAGKRGLLNTPIQFPGPLPPVPPP